MHVTLLYRLSGVAVVLLALAFGQASLSSAPFQVDGVAQSGVSVDQDLFQPLRGGVTAIVSRGALAFLDRAGAVFARRALPASRQGRADPVWQFYFGDRERGWSWSGQSLWETTDGGRTWKSVALPVLPDKSLVIHSVGFDSVRRRVFVSFGFDDDAAAGSRRLALYSSVSPVRRSWRLEHSVTGARQGVVTLRRTAAGALWVLRHGVEVEKGDGKWVPAEFTETCNAGLAAKAPSGLENRAVYFLDEIHGWLRAEDWRIFRTRDGGRTWCQVSTSDQRRGSSSTIYFATAELGLAAHELGSVLVTSNGGATWTPLGLKQRFAGIAPTGEGRGCLVGHDGSLFAFSQSTR